MEKNITQPEEQPKKGLTGTWPLIIFIIGIILLLILAKFLIG